MSDEQIIQDLQRAAERRKLAEDERHAASAALREHIQDAHAAGIGPTRIAEASGLSRQAVYEALGQRPSLTSRSKSSFDGTGTSRSPSFAGIT